MRHRNSSPIPTSAVEEVRTDLAEWRKAHRAPTPFPEEVWNKAVGLATRYGVHRTARALGLGYDSLRKRVNSPAVGRATSPPASPTFVEWLPAVSNHIGECALTVTAPNGGQLQMELKNVPPAALVAVLCGFNQ